MKGTCKMCKESFVGRSDKIFCSAYCKNLYHKKLREVNTLAVKDIDKILHRNRAILLEIMGKNTKQKQVPRKALDRKKFNYKYMTGFHINSKNKTYRLVYDFAWMEFTKDKILIIRR